jgi:pyridoxal phosphate enzyme (YggS family)
MKRKISDNIRRVQERIANACRRANRDPEEVSLVAVTKYVGVDVIRQLLELGYTEIGEARVQELTRRAAMIQEMRTRLGQGGAGPGFPEPHWHMVGHLQRNKAKHLLPWVSMIHSLDSLRLAEEISHQAERLDRDVDVLIQVNAAGEQQKSGVAVGAVPHLAEQVVSLPRLRVCGLMGMAPLADDGGKIAWTFERLREIFDDLRSERFVGPEFRHLSMGMTNDFEVAIQYGATMLRIGSALFEGVLAPA